MPSVVFTPQQISQISSHWASIYFAGGTNTPQNCATMSITDLNNAVSQLAMSISIGSGSVAYSPAFPPPFNTASAPAQAAMISYIIQMAMGVPLVG
jgi:hypothetical protein